MTKVDSIRKEVQIPKGITMTHKGDILEVKGPKGSLVRTFRHPRLSLDVSSSAVIVGVDHPIRAEMVLAGTWESHVKNMIKGVTKGFEYKMKIIYSHFPIKTSVKGQELVIENFLGERYPRKARIVEGVTVKISGDSIVLSGIDKENVGQTAANIEKTTVVRNYDPRVFQDGIYLVERGE